jgi:chemotaxis protein CheD
MTIPEAARTVVAVGMGELTLSSDPSKILVIYGLGSCVGVCAYDPELGLGGVLHVMLPASGQPREPLTRYADRGVEALLQRMEDEGADLGRTQIRLAGGASLIALESNPGLASIGDRNLLSVRQTLAHRGLQAVAEHVGGNVGRRLELAIADGTVTVRVVGGQSSIL